VVLCGFTPDGRRVFLGPSTWDAETGQELPPLLEQQSSGWVCGVSADHGRIVISDGGLCRVREAGSGREVGVCSAHDFRPPSLEALSAMGDYFVRACAVDPEGNRVATGCGSFYAVWDANTGETLISLPGNSFLPACTFTPDGRRVAATDDRGRCFIVDLGGADSDGRVRESDSLRREPGVSSRAFHPDWHPEESADRRTTLAIPNGVMTACCFSPDGNRLLTGTTEGHAILWDAGTGDRLATLPGHSRDVLSCGFSPDGSRIVTGGRDGSIRLWAAEADDGSAEAFSVFRGHDGGVVACAFSPDSSRLVTVGGEGSCKLWRVPRGMPGTSGGAGPSETRLSDARTVQAMAFQANEPRIASVIEGRVTVRNLKTGKEIATLGEVPGPERGEVRSLAFSTCGHRLAVGTGRPRRADPVGGAQENTCTVWDLERKEELAVLKGHTDEVTACAFTPDGLGLVTGSADLYCKVWDLTTSEVLAVSEKHSSPVVACNVSPCGSKVVSVSSGACKIWDPLTGGGIGSLYGHRGEVRACAFSPDGSKIVTGSKDGTCRIWDPESRKELLTLSGHGGSVEACIFSSDGLRIISASKDRTVRVWSARTGQCIGTLPLQGEGRVLAHDPGGTCWASGDTSGAVYLTDLVKAKGELLAFQDPRWQGVPHDEGELELALRGPVILYEPVGLDTVRWDRLEHAYGSAQDVPAFLRMLGAEDMEVRDKAFQSLLMTILHQGSLYSATVAAVPFLLRLAANPDHPARLEAMELVRMIVSECSFEAYRRHRKRMREEDGDGPGPDGSENDVVGSIEKLLWADLGRLKELAKDEDPNIHEMALFIMGELAPADSRD
jgi:WD40 repeat protein